jgi:diacylglycerol O-acyltransferase / wax synthase
VRPPLLDRTRPLSTTLAVGHRPGASRRKLGVLLVLHHAVADGLRGVKMITSLLDPTPDDRVDGVTWRPESARTGRELVADNLRRRWEAVRRFSPVATAAIGAYAARAVPRIWSAPSTSLTGPIWRHRQLTVLRYPIVELRAAARSRLHDQRSAYRRCHGRTPRPAQRPRRMPRWTRAARLGSSWSPRRWK